MSFLRASLRSGVQIGYAPHIALAKVSNLLWDSTEEHQFITGIYGILDSTNRTFVFSNAGHNPPLLIKPDGEYRYVEYGDLPLGMNALQELLNPEAAKAKEVITQMKEGRYQKRKREGKANAGDDE